ncbi:short-chain dehydrogenase [Sphingobium sp. SCG-1]|uniref:glucose 1-dehydrogenase n=1 Tax=Sphingobium sp. SCG-1 TaxID=2072936 RepID=UPI000CD6BC48|nr:glucose 1-dehydrogenase [Sphingobium sp. SCG-1]AUW58944.1 short-chain dehydrogenase [Sphingobium sp. SCG-1]
MTHTDHSTPLRPFLHRLDNRVALVTGGASGLGAAIAARLAEEGARVWVADIDSQGAAVQASLLKNGAAIALDVTCKNQWHSVISRVEDIHGRLDILVNNAGITTMGSIETLDVDAFRHELEIDVVGVFLGCQSALRLMRTTGGSIINIASAAGLKADAGLVGYNAAKAAVTLMTKSIALHCARQKYGIRCNSVHPGAIHTPIIDKVLAQVPNPTETMDGFLAAHPIGHLGHPDDVAAIVAYLASDESRFATGAAFSIDGGMTAL